MDKRVTDARGEERMLVERAVHGDHAAFGALVRRYEPRLLAYLAQMLGDADAARDVAQETFLAAYLALPRWHAPDEAQTPSEPSSLLWPWLYRIATNKALSLLRAGAARSPAAGAPRTLRDDPDTESAIDGFEERYAARELLRGALRHLSHDDAACLVLHYVVGERYSEIAARLGLTSEAVRKRVSRGLAVLRAAYAALDAEARR